MAFNKLVDMDNACCLLRAYIERARLVQSDVTTELEEADVERLDRENAAMLCLTVRRVAVLSEIVFDYLCMMEERANQMNELVQEGFKAWQKDVP